MAIGKPKTDSYTLPPDMPEQAVQGLLANALTTAATEAVSDTIWYPGTACSADREMVISTDTHTQWQLKPDAAVVAPHGQRYRRDPSNKNRVYPEVCGLDPMLAINQHVGATLLRAENCHVPQLVHSPQLGGGTGSKANNDAWLKSIREGFWPLMLNGQGEPNSHDLGVHLANMMLFPREMSDQLSEGAGHTLDYRRRHGSSVLILSDESAEMPDPCAHSFARYGSRSGIDVIDTISDAGGYTRLLGYLVLKPPSERQAAMQELVDLSAPTSPLVSYKAEKPSEALRKQRATIRDIVNFNTRYGQGRQATADELDEAEAYHINGILRVATTIREGLKAA